MVPLEISVSGQAKIKRSAERCVLTIAVQSSGDNKQRVSSEVTRTSAELTKSFKALNPRTPDGAFAADAAITVFSVSSMSTRSWVPRRDTGDEDWEKPRQYEATSTFTVHFQHFDKMGEVLSTLFSREHVDIQSIHWKLTESTMEKLEISTRADAIKDAISKAEAYASIIGRKVAVCSVEDRSTSYRGYASQELGRYASVAQGAAADEKDEEEDGPMIPEPEDVEVTANVDVNFIGEDESSVHRWIEKAKGPRY